MPSIRFSREVEVRHQVDVFVAGGGPTGIAAAVTAAREGRSVFLAEGSACFGGMATAGLLPLFMAFGDGEHFYAGGIGREIYDLMYACGATYSAPGEMAPTIKAEPLKRVYDDLISDAGVSFGLMTNLVGVEAEGSRVTTAICFGKSGFFAVEAAAFVDGTGDGDLCAWAGAPYEKGDEQGRLMPGTLCSLWARVDWPKVWATRQGLGDEARLPQAIADGVFTLPDLHLPGMFPVGEGLAGGNVGHLFGVDGTDERSLTEALVWGRKSLAEYERYYKEYFEGFEQMELVSTALPGIRESRRILGDYVLCLEDFNSRASFPDDIGRYSYPVDIHAAVAGAEEQEQAREEFLRLRYQTGESYGIPYRSLLPRGLDNAWVAGRCLSADRAVQSSLRVMPGCFITGQAAGMAAAMAVEAGSDSRAVDVGELQARLRAMGAYLPEGR